MRADDETLTLTHLSWPILPPQILRHVSSLEAESESLSSVCPGVAGPDDDDDDDDDDDNDDDE